MFTKTIDRICLSVLGIFMFLSPVIIVAADFVYAVNTDGKQSSIKSKLITIGDFQKLYPKPNDTANDQAKPVGAFSIYHHLKTDNGKTEENGFYRVGDSVGKPYGWLKKEEVVLWKTRFVLEPTVNSSNGVFTLYNVRKSEGDEENLLDEPVVLAQPAGQKRLRLAFILEPPKKDLGDDTQYSVICLDRQADQDAGGISDIQNQIDDLSLQIVFVYEATDALVWDIQGVTMKQLLGGLMNRVATSFTEAKVDKLVQFGIVAFQDRSTYQPKDQPNNYPVKVIQKLTTNFSSFKQAANNLPAHPIGGDWSEDGLSGIDMALKMLAVDKKSSAHIVYFGMSAPHEHATGQNHTVWGRTEKYPSGGSYLANFRRTTGDDGFTGSTLPGLTVDSIIRRASPTTQNNPLTSTTIHTIFSTADYATVQSLPKDYIDTLTSLIGPANDILAKARNDAELDALAAAHPSFGEYEDPTSVVNGALRVGEFNVTQQRGFGRLKLLAINDHNYHGFHGTANATAAEYKNVGEDLYTELYKIVPVLQAAQKGDPKAVETLTNKENIGDGKFTSGSFRTASQQMLSEILNQPTFIADAPVRDDDGYLVAHKQVLVSRKELALFSNKLNGMIELFKGKAERSARSDIKKLLDDLQKFAVETVTGDTLGENDELSSIITELPLQTSALDMNVKSLAVMDREDFERWVESIRLSEKRCNDILGREANWMALSSTAVHDKFAFIRIEDMP
jgi:hypothetical protein